MQFVQYAVENHKTEIFMGLCYAWPTSLVGSIVTAGTIQTIGAKRRFREFHQKQLEAVVLQ